MQSPAEKHDTISLQSIVCERLQTNIKKRIIEEKMIFKIQES